MSRIQFSWLQPKGYPGNQSTQWRLDSMVPMRSIDEDDPEVTVAMMTLLDMNCVKGSHVL